MQHILLTVMFLSLPAFASARDYERFGYIDSQTQRYIERLHSEESSSSRASALRSLASRCNAAAQDAIKGALNDKSSTVRSAAKNALEHFEHNCKR
jgi:HEAT repeat protein